MQAISPALARRIAAAILALSTTACIGLGGNVKGSFSCRAPEGDCAPSHVIDARATAELASAADSHFAAARRRAGLASSDSTRTAERTIRIVFPAHVDEAGTLHDEAHAWAVVEPPQWAGQLRGDEAPTSMRQLRRQLKHAQRKNAQAGSGTSGPPPLSADTAAEQEPALAAEGEDEPATFLPSDYQLSPFASPLSLPSPAAEASPGASAPAAEGSIVPPPLHEKTPRPSALRLEGPSGEGPSLEYPSLEYPSLEALEAAKQRNAAGRKPRDTEPELVPARPGSAESEPEKQEQPR